MKKHKMFHAATLAAKPALTPKHNSQHVSFVQQKRICIVLMLVKTDVVAGIVIEVGVKIKAAPGLVSRLIGLPVGS
jgi:hypothetical protein